MNKVLHFPVLKATVQAPAHRLTPDVETMPLHFQGPAPSRGIYVEASAVPGRSILIIVDSLGVTRVWCEIDSDWCDDQAIWLATQKLEQADPVPSRESRAVGSPRLTLSSGGGL